MSQEELAHEAGVERNYVSLLERGKNSASIKIIFKLAVALKISVTEFVGLIELRVTGQKAENQ